MMKIRKLIDNEDGTHTVPLTQGKYAIIDSKYATEVGKYNWCAFHQGKNLTRWYAMRNLPGKKKRKGNGSQRLHQFIMEIEHPNLVDEIDHIDHNGLNNKLENLRVCTRTANNANRRKTPHKNSSMYKGVCYIKNLNRWRAYIDVFRKRKYIGDFDNEIDAARAYDAAATIAFKEFSYINFPDNPPTEAEITEIKLILENDTRRIKTSKYMGVYYSKANRKWIARIGINKQHIAIGSFNNELVAARAFDAFAVAIGRTKINFSDELPSEESVEDARQKLALKLVKSEGK